MGRRGLEELRKQLTGQLQLKTVEKLKAWLKFKLKRLAWKKKDWRGKTLHDLSVLRNLHHPTPLRFGEEPSLTCLGLGKSLQTHQLLLKLGQMGTLGQLPMDKQLLIL